jgi:putative selenate reductase
MGDRMKGVPIEKLLNQVFTEYARYKTIFGIPEKFFWREESAELLTYCGEELALPLGPAAGPHTQLAQNLAAAYLVGGRFFELKTVQVLDSLEFPKPCINAEDECYNTEWSTELSIEAALEEYIKGWFLVHLLSKELFQAKKRSFIFNMSVGYDLAGIKSPKVDRFIEGMKNASSTDIFGECKEALRLNLPRCSHVDESFIDSISPELCSSIALSTMHGCPPSETEAICHYLLIDKKLNTQVKLNPTLLGFEFVHHTLDKMGYSHIKLTEESFSADLHYDEAVLMLEKLIELATAGDREFGVKLSNTLPVKITRGELPGEQMYLSGKPLYALTINLAAKLAGDFGNRLKISYSGGADSHNLAQIASTGIQPVTVVSTLLKPRGYLRLKKLAEITADTGGLNQTGIDIDKLKQVAADAVADSAFHRKEKKVRTYKPLPLFDCRGSCSICTDVCPNRANVKVLFVSDLFKFDQQILHLDGLCNECGNCATFCPEMGKPYLEKLTYFPGEEDFSNSSNSGFLLKENTPEAALKIRINNKVLELNSADHAPENEQKVDRTALKMIDFVCKNYEYLL